MSVMKHKTGRWFAVVGAVMFLASWYVNAKYTQHEVSRQFEILSSKHGRYVQDGGPERLKRLEDELGLEPWGDNSDQTD